VNSDLPPESRRQRDAFKASSALLAACADGQISSPQKAREIHVTEARRTVRFELNHALEAGPNGVGEDLKFMTTPAAAGKRFGTS